MFQTGSEKAFDLWVKTIAIELIRQTPLDSVKYLDILTLTECWNRKEAFNDTVQSSTPTDLPSEEILPKLHPTQPETKPNIIYDVNRNPVIPTEKVINKKVPAPQESTDVVDSGKKFHVKDEEAVEVLLKKCQNPESYVPVKEKLVLFESLCRLGRKVRSTEDVTFKIEVETKRARSLHDLSSCFGSHIAVREICKYFETKGEEEAGNYPIVNRTNRRLINSDSQLNNVRKYTQHLHNISCA